MCSPAFPRSSPQGTPEALPYPFLRRMCSPSQSRAALRRACRTARPRRAGGAASAVGKALPPKGRLHFLSASTDVRLRSQERSEKTIKTVPIRKDNTAPTACPILLARTCSHHFLYPLSHLCCDLAHSAASVARILFLPLCAYQPHESGEPGRV